MVHVYTRLYTIKIITNGPNTSQYPALLPIDDLAIILARKTLFEKSSRSSYTQVPHVVYM